MSNVDLKSNFIDFFFTILFVFMVLFLKIKVVNFNLASFLHPLGMF